MQLSKKKKTALESKWDLLFEENCTEWLSFTPKKGLYVYPCYACWQMFSSKSAFLDHVNRRAVLFVFRCKICSTTPVSYTTFYSSCALLLHLRDHFTKSKPVIDLNDLEMQILPVGMAGFSPMSGIPSLYEDPETSPQNFNTKFYYPHKSSRGQQIIQLNPSYAHFLQDNQLLTLRQISKNIPKCEFIVKTDLNNEKMSKSESELFKIPVISKIESLNKPNIVVCTECKEVIDKPLKVHFRGDDKPLDETLICKMCKYIAPTKCSYQAHVRLHDRTSPFVCPDCGRSFAELPELLGHMEETCFHLSKHIRFKCAGKKCGKIFVMSSSYSTHFETHLQPQARCITCNRCYSKSTESEAHKKQFPDHINFDRVYHCSVCSYEQELINDDNYSDHIKKHVTDRNRCLYVYMCKSCKSFCRSEQTFAVHLVRCAKTTEIIKKQQVTESQSNNECENCKKKVNGVTKLCSKCDPSQEEHPKRIKCKYSCVLCNVTFAEEDRVKHLQDCKYSNPLVQLSEEDRCDLSIISTESLQHALLQAKTLKKEKNEVVTYDIESEKPTKAYKCHLCYTKIVDRKEFQAHVKRHRDVSTAYQCMECGECFVVKPSLIKHLRHYHYIEDAERYIEENDCFDKRAVQALNEVMHLAPGESLEPVKENQCRVCKMEFSSNAALSKHFRVHGMAFLMKNVLKK